MTLIPASCGPQSGYGNLDPEPIDASTDELLRKFGKTLSIYYKIWALPIKKATMDTTKKEGKAVNKTRLRWLQGDFAWACMIEFKC